MPIPQELFFLWDGHLARPIYFCKRSIFKPRIVSVALRPKKASVEANFLGAIVVF